MGCGRLLAGASHAHRQADPVEFGIAQQALGHRQEFGLFARDVPLIHLRETVDLVLRQQHGLAGRHLSQHRAQGFPAGFEFAVLGGERRRHLLQAHRVRAGHRLEQRREEISLFVVVVVVRRCVEVAHHGRGGFARRPIRAVRRDVRHQALQRCTLVLHPQVAGREHLQRHLESDGGGRIS